jgi:hypothetical protein
MVPFFHAATMPTGVETIMPVKNRDGSMDWYKLDAKLFSWLNGMDLYRMPKVLDLLFGAPTRMFRLGTTGLRAGFSLITNPLRDVQTFTLQTHTDSKWYDMTSEWLHLFRTIISYEFSRDKQNKPMPKELEVFLKLGGAMSTPLGADKHYTKRVSNSLFGNRIFVKPENIWDVFGILADTVDVARDKFSIPESATRAAELKMVADQRGIDLNGQLTVADSLALLHAAKRVTTDFTAAGKYAKIANQVIPFFNASIQGTRTFARTVRRNPSRAAAHGFWRVAFPTLALWWAYKDEDWYKEMPYWERYTYWHIPINEKVVMRIPKPFEWGYAFAVLPEATFDTAYRATQGDPDAHESFVEGLKHVFEGVSPVGRFNIIEDPATLFLRKTTVGKFLKEQDQNWNQFAQRPIVPGSEDVPNYPKEQQIGPYTSDFAQMVGWVFQDADWAPDYLQSPRRFDHLIRSYGGGVLPDSIRFVENVKDVIKTRNVIERSPADIPVLGRLFRRGGMMGTHSLSVAKMWDMNKQYQEQYYVYRDKSARGEPEKHRQTRLMLKDAIEVQKSITMLAIELDSDEAQRDLMALRIAVAQDAVQRAKRPREWNRADFKNRWDREKRRLQREAAKEQRGR